jgi:hypothetical protein
VEASDRQPERKPDETSGGTPPGQPPKDGAPWLDLLARIGRTVGPALLAAGGLIGFVAFAGSIIVWTRFSVAQVPPDQVVAAFPRGELVAIASSRLLLFGFVGIVAVAVFFLISRHPKDDQEDQETTATTGIFRGLLVLFAVEAGAAIVLVDSAWIDKAIAWELFVLAIAIAFWFTFIFERPELWKTKDGSPKDGAPKTGAQHQKAKAGPKSEKDGDGFIEQFQNLGSEAISPSLVEHRRFRSIIAVTIALVVTLGGLFWLGGTSFEAVVIGGVALVIFFPSFWLLLIWVKEEKKKEEELMQRVPREPGSIPYTRWGQALIAVLLLVAAIVPARVLETGWLVAPLLIGGILVMGAWRVAVLFDGGFVWYGLAVFISVVFFGAFTWSARDIADPQVQPVALIRQQDGPDESLQGIYVTETSDRIYFATVATEGCTNDIVPHSGRLLWVPKSDVVAMSIGPLQSVDDAAKTALEMSYALTPAVETPAGDHVSLTVAEKRENLGGEEATPQKRRLEDVGPAVQPSFGAGLRLRPENVSPGDVVTLTMAAPNEHGEVEGFGASRQGRTLRLGGVPVDIIKEEAGSTFEAEYVETSNGSALNLRKGALYARQYGKWVEAHQADELQGAPPFVRLTDESAMELDERGQRGDNYLPLESAEGGPPRLDIPEGRPPEVTLDNGSRVTLKTRLLRQAWHEDRIRFRVPENASTGAITVECEQLAGQPLLRVAQPPRANITVQIAPGSNRVLFDSERSNGKDKIVSRQWWVEGIDRGKGERMAVGLPPRSQGYAIRLTVTDSEGQTGTSQVHLLRLPANLVALDKRRSKTAGILRAARAELRQATAVEPAAAIEFAMRPGDLPEPPKPTQMIDRAEEVRRYLLKARPAQSTSQPADPDGLVVKTMAFGGSCPAKRDSEVGRLDVLVLGQGARVIPPEECPVVRLSTARWLLPPP